MRKKVTVIGAGNVGATTAERIHGVGYADVVLVDVVEDLSQGKALDMLESAPVLGTDARITGSNGYEESAGSDLVIITAGIARKPGMSRDDLLLTNAKIVGDITTQVVKYSPEALLLVVTNPLDAMTQRGLRDERLSAPQGIWAWQESSIPHGSGPLLPRSSTCQWRTFRRMFWAVTVTTWSP